jgi:gas vesicle protein
MLIDSAIAAELVAIRDRLVAEENWSQSRTYSVTWGVATAAGAPDRGLVLSVHVESAVARVLQRGMSDSVDIASIIRFRRRAMASILNDTMNAARFTMGTARENAGITMGLAKEGAEHAVASTRSAVLDGLRTVTGFIAMLRKIDGDDALGWIGLARRRSPLYSVAVFGAGMAVGAGVGMMLAPMSGQELRARILDQLRGAKGDATEPTVEVATTAQGAGGKVDKKVEAKVESSADKSGDGAMHARQQVSRSTSRQPS